MHRLAVHGSAFGIDPKFQYMFLIITHLFSPSFVNYCMLLLASKLPVYLSVVYFTIPSAALIILYQRDRISEHATGWDVEAEVV